jgi:hypothetical protein
MFNQLASKLGVYKLRDWQNVTAASVLSQPGTGQKTLDNIRGWLAKQGLTLKDDRTPEFWLSQSPAKLVCPFTIAIDSKEQLPFTFSDIHAGASQDYKAIVVETKVKHLGPTHGDYSMVGFEGQIHIERKSMDDAHGTLLGWGERRERFEQTLAFLSTIEFGAVIVECTLGQLLANAPEHGRKTKTENKRSLNQTILAWMRRYNVQWLFCDTRGLAETETFRLFEGFYASKIRSQKIAQKTSRKLSQELNLV